MQGEEGAKFPNRHRLRDQLFLEAHAMAEYALANGKPVPAQAIRTVEAFADARTMDGETSVPYFVKPDLDIDDLLAAHSALAKAIEPAKPRSVLLLKDEREKTGFLQFLGPVALIQQMMLAALIALTLFVGLGLSDQVNQNGGDILGSSGWPLLLNLLFFLSAAGLGAAFAALYKANAYITAGTFDPTYHASYWIRFLLGLISGLVLSVMISSTAFETAMQGNGLFAPGITRPILAMLGGFSADLVYTILYRLVDTLESLFRGSPKNTVATKVEEEKLRLANNQAQQQMRLASELVVLQQDLDKADSAEDVKERLRKLIGDIVPADVRTPARKALTTEES